MSFGLLVALQLCRSHVWLNRPRSLWSMPGYIKFYDSHDNNASHMLIYACHDSRAGDSRRGCINKWSNYVLIRGRVYANLLAAAANWWTGQSAVIHRLAQQRSQCGTLQKLVETGETKRDDDHYGRWWWWGDALRTCTCERVTSWKVSNYGSLHYFAPLHTSAHRRKF